jgi:hypothetical protein
MAERFKRLGEFGVSRPSLAPVVRRARYDDERSTITGATVAQVKAQAQAVGHRVNVNGMRKGFFDPSGKS